MSEVSFPSDDSRPMNVRVARALQELALMVDLELVSEFTISWKTGEEPKFNIHAGDALRSQPAAPTEETGN